MEDFLKKHIEQNRNDFEIDSEGLVPAWDDIAATLDEKENKKWFKLSYVWKAAAMIVLGLGISWIWVLQTKAPSNETASFEQQLYKVAPDLAEAEMYYSSLIAEKMQIIKANKDAIDSHILDDVATLDAIYDELKNDLRDNANNEEVIEAMLEHHRMKLNILEQILEEIQKTNDDDDEKFDYKQL